MEWRGCRQCGLDVIVFDLVGGLCEPCRAETTLNFGDTTPLSELATTLGVSPQQLISRLYHMGVRGVRPTSSVDFDTAKLLAKEYGYAVAYDAFPSASGEAKEPPEPAPAKPQASVDDIAAPDDEVTTGFTQPEDGSEERYRDRRRVRPWLEYTGWWLLHNCVAHPLIGVLPTRATFQFHDWTSRKMFGA